MRPHADRLGDLVIDFHKVAKAYGDRVLIEDFDLSIPPYHLSFHGLNQWLA